MKIYDLIPTDGRKSFYRGRWNRNALQLQHADY